MHFHVSTIDMQIGFTGLSIGYYLEKFNKRSLLRMKMSDNLQLLVLWTGFEIINHQSDKACLHVELQVIHVYAQLTSVDRQNLSSDDYMLTLLQKCCEYFIKSIDIQKNYVWYYYPQVNTITHAVHAEKVYHM